MNGRTNGALVRGYPRIWRSLLRWTAVLAAMSGVGAASAETLRFSQWLAPSHPIVTQTLMPWFAEVEKATEGRVRIEYMAAPLGPPPAQFDLVRDGVVDMAINVHGFAPGRFKLTNLGELPFLSLDSEPLSVAFYRTYKKYFESANEHKGVIVLSMWSTRPGHIWTREVAVTDLKQLEGMKIMGANSINVEMAKALGATPVQAPPSKYYEMLQRGIVDGAFIDHSSYKDFNLSPILKSITEFPQGLYSGTLYLMINPAKWQAISAADRTAIEALSGESFARRAGKNWDKAAQESVVLMKQSGMKFNTPDAKMVSGMKEKLEFIEQRFIETANSQGFDGTAAVASLRAEIKKEQKSAK